MSRALLLVGRHVVRVSDALIYDRDRRRRIRRFHRVSRVTLVAEAESAESGSPSVASTNG